MSCVRLPGFSWPATTKRRRRKSVGSLSGFSRRSPTAAGCSYVRARFIVIRFFFFFSTFWISECVDHSTTPSAIQQVDSHTKKKRKKIYPSL
jgi:hypothetical protein